MVATTMQVPDPFRCPISCNSLGLQLHFKGLVPPWKACAASSLTPLAFSGATRKVRCEGPQKHWAQLWRLRLV